MANATAAVRVGAITGGARGLGQAFAVRLAEAGVDIALIDSSPCTETEEQVRARGRRAVGMLGDVSSAEAVAAFARLVKEEFGRCDILVNNAAIFPRHLFEDMTFEQWRKVFSVNLDGAFLTCKAFVPLMKANGYGRIINIASGQAIKPQEGLAHYAASKAALIGLSRTIARELGRFGITVNVLAPGLFNTPGTRAARNASGQSLDERAPAIVERQSIKRLGQPEDIAGVLAFLASDEARFMTGQVVIVDGGQL